MKTCPQCGVTYRRTLVNETCGRCRAKEEGNRRDREERARLAEARGRCNQCGAPVRNNGKRCRRCWQAMTRREKRQHAEGCCRERHPALDALLAERVELYRQRAERGEPLFTEVP